MKKFAVEMTIKVIYLDGHTAFNNVKGIYSGENELIASNKCFLKNKKAYSSIASIDEVSIFEYEATLISEVEGSDGGVAAEDDYEDDDASINTYVKPKVKLGFVGRIFIKMLRYLKFWVGLDSLGVASALSVWFYCHSMNASVHMEYTIGVIVGLGFIVPIVFSFLSNAMARAIAKNTVAASVGALESTFETILANVGASILNVLGLYFIVSVLF